MWARVLAVAVGAFIGGVLRVWTSSMLNRGAGRIPVGTLAVNIVGSFVLGLMIGWTAHGPVAPQLQALVMTGLCGGLTTFSTFCGDTVQLFATSPMPGPWHHARLARRRHGALRRRAPYDPHSAG